MMAFIRRTYQLLRTFWHIRRLRHSSDEQVRQKARQCLSASLAASRGLPMKVGQVLAGMDDTSDYAALTTSVEAWSLDKMLPVLQQAWGKPPMMLLQSIEESRAAASLGQVHAAQLNAQEKVAIKIQYPDIAQAVHTEMTLAGWMPQAGPVKTWAFDMSAYQQELRKNMQQELDYLHEMKQQMRFAGAVHVQGLSVPTVYPSLCRSQVLVQGWVNGVRLHEAATWGIAQRVYIARTLMQTMFQSLFQVGLVHGDPHPGNLLFTPDDEPTTYLLDFGCMVTVEEEVRMALLNMILVARGEKQVDLLALFQAMGFDEHKLQHMRQKLPMLVQLLCRPFVEARGFDVAAWQLSDEMDTLLGDDKWWFRSAAPARLFLVVRIVQGLCKQLELLQARLPWSPLLQQALSEQTWQQAQAWQCGNVALADTPKVGGSARSVHIHLKPNDKAAMDICLQASAALELHDLMPEHIRQEIQDVGIDFLAMRTDLLQHGLEPQVLVDVEMPTYHCRIELCSEAVE